MTPPPDPTIKQYLSLFVAQFSLAALLLDTMPPHKPIQRGMATAIATADEIKGRLELATETEQRGMLIAARENIKGLMTLIQGRPIAITAAKARREWITTCKQILKETEEWK